MGASRLFLKPCPHASTGLGCLFGLTRDYGKWKGWGSPLLLPLAVPQCIHKQKQAWKLPPADVRIMAARSSPPATDQVHADFSKGAVSVLRTHSDAFCPCAGPSFKKYPRQCQSVTSFQDLEGKCVAKGTVSLPNGSSAHRLQPCLRLLWTSRCSNRAEAEVKGQSRTWEMEKDTALRVCSAFGVIRVVVVSRSLCPVDLSWMHWGQHPGLRKSLLFCFAFTWQAHLGLIF